MKKFGIDVSKWQGSYFDFAKAKNEDKVEFVILRGAYSCPSIRTNGGKDTQFENYYKKCQALSLPVGVYQYSLATTIAQAKEEAEYLYSNVLKGKKFELPIYIDIEDNTQYALSKQALTDIAVAWCEYLEAKGYWVGIYAGKYTFRDQLDDSRLKGYAHWIAQWAKSCSYTGEYGMWQFGGEKNPIRSTQIAGQTVDQNYMYVDYPKLIKEAKLNGYAGATPTHSVADIEAAKLTVKTKAGLADKTIDYLMKYQHGNDLITKLAKAMK